MEKANPKKDLNKGDIQKIPNIEDSIFNSKLFLNINLNNDYLNNSFSQNSEDSTEIEDSNSSSFLTKELIDELNSLNSDITFKDKKSFNNKSFLYSVNNANLFTPNNQANNINKEDKIQNGFFSGRFNKYNLKSYNKFKSNYDYKRYKIIKDKKRDWVCQLCLNLNYSFRNECNRCKLPKETCIQNINYMI